MPRTSHPTPAPADDAAHSDATSSAGAAPAAVGYDPAADPQWTRVAFRITGLGVFLFILVCVTVGSLLRVSPDAFNTAVGYPQGPLGVVGAVILFAAVLFHALHAVRIALADLTSWGARNQRALVTVASVLWLALMVCGTYLITRHTLLEFFGKS